MSSIRIGITGKLCSGKSKLADIIKQKYSFFEIKSFASKIKEIATDIFDMKETD